MLQKVWLNIDSFEELKELEKFLVNDKLLLTRSTITEEKRRLHYNNIGFKGKKIDKWIRKKLFIKHNLDKGAISYDKAVLTPNNFPVELPNGVEHWLVWIDDYDISKLDALQLCQILFAKKGWKNENIIVFEKHIKRRSVPEIRHFHVYVKV